ncbi:hypothetical protein BGZ51_007231 [Haplosporangium sp. Z 767]|nr:hypothetical protein BGZ51_007231 [Haplosporangium sp. Z 767]
MIQSVCNTPHCSQSAAEILRDIQPSADPCVDFSQFACGGFYAREQIPEGESSVNNFDSLANHNNALIRSFVTRNDPNAPVAPQGDLAQERNIRKFQSLYGACMDRVQLARVGRRPLQAEVHKIVEVYPVIDSFLHLHRRDLPDRDRRGLSTLMGYNLKNGFENLFVFDIQNDDLNPGHKVMTLYMWGLGLPGISYYSQEDLVQTYAKIIGKMFYYIQGNGRPLKNRNVPGVWQHVGRDVVAFEVALAKITREADDMADPDKMFQPHAISELDQLTPSLDWTLLLQTAFPQDTPLPTTLNIPTPEYFRKLDKLLQDTSRKTLQNYFAWTVMRTLGHHLAEPFTEPLQELTEALTGQSGVPERWKTCVELINNNLGDMVGHYFIKDAFKGNSLAAVNDILDSLRQAYEGSFTNYNWLDAETREKAIEKVKAIVQKVGYGSDAPNVASSESIDEFYRELEIKPEDHFGNQVRSMAWTAASRFRSLSKPVNKKSMDMPPQTVNAYYDPTQNEVVFPAGILQPPFFHVENQDYLNYGAIGSVAGHEVGHAFDNNGGKYDASGRFSNWWTNSTLTAFNEKAQCFVDQYSKFTLPGPDGKTLHVDGQLTLGENIADNGGIKKSFEAWSARYQSDATGKTYNNHVLPGLEAYTPEQLFFIQFARLYCSKMTPELTQRIILGDPHTPAVFRVNGVVQNSEYFATAFKCQPGTPMNPATTPNATKTTTTAVWTRTAPTKPVPNHSKPKKKMQVIYPVTNIIVGLSDLLVHNLRHSFQSLTHFEVRDDQRNSDAKSFYLFTTGTFLLQPSVLNKSRVCKVAREENRRNQVEKLVTGLKQVLSDPHSPYRRRLHGSLQNSNTLANAFKRKIGVPLNPIKKCPLW